ncbi:MAG: tetratricopeptide repeat protein [Planctomycetota bacterium]
MSQSSQNPIDNSGELAWAAYESGRYELALQYAFESLSRNPEQANLHFLASSSCLRLDRYSEARQFAKQGIELAPASWLGYQALAWAIITDSRYAPGETSRQDAATQSRARIAEAKKLLATALKLNPVDSDLYALQAEIAFLEEDHGQARSSALQGLTFSPNSVLLRMKKIRALRAQSKTDEAMAVVDEALSLQPEHSRCLGIKAELELEKGNVDVALRAARSGVQLDPESDENREVYWDAIKAKNRFLRPIVTWQFVARKLHNLPRIAKTFAISIPILGGFGAVAAKEYFQNEGMAIVVIAAIFPGTMFFVSERPGMIIADVWMYLTDRTFRASVDRKELVIEISIGLASVTFFLAAVGSLWSFWVLGIWCYCAMVYFPIGIIVLSPYPWAKALQLINLIVFSTLIYFAVRTKASSVNGKRLVEVYMMMGAGFLALAGPLLHFNKYDESQKQAQ